LGGVRGWGDVRPPIWTRLTLTDIVLGLERNAQGAKRLGEEGVNPHGSVAPVQNHL